MEHKPGVKRQLDECEGGESEGEDREMEVTEEGGDGGRCGGAKRAKDEGTPVGQGGRDGADNGQDDTAQTTRPDLNFPLPGETGLPCLVKVSYTMDHL